MGRFLGSLFSILCADLKQAAINVFQLCWNGWNSFWFSEADPTINSIMRIFAGGMVLYTHLVWSIKLDAFFGPDGWQNVDVMKAFQAPENVYSFWYFVPPEWLWPVHIVCLCLFAMYLIGAATPVTKWLVYILTVSYAHRAQMANFGLDQMNAILCFYLAIGPCGARFSFDSWWKKRKLRQQGKALPKLKKSVSANLSMRLIQVHLCVIYIFAGISKLQGELWWNGFAVWNAAANLEYQSNSLLWLAHVPWLCNVLTLTTIFWEISFAGLVWNKRLRPIVLAIGAGMHIGIGAFLGMWTFGLVMTFMYLAFIPPDDAQKMLAFFPNLLRDAKQGKRTRTAIDSVKRVQHLEVATDSVRSAEGDLSVDTVTRHTYQPSRRGKHILVVSDSWKPYQLFHKYFHDRNHLCLPATDLQTAGALIRNHDFDGVILLKGKFNATDFQDFQENLRSLNGHSPASLVIENVNGPLLKYVDTSNPKHCILSGNAKLGDIREILFAAIDGETATTNSTRKTQVTQS